MSEHVSLSRLHLLRGMYLLNLVFLGSQVWPVIIGGDRVGDQLPGVAFSFWAALSALSALGLRYPLAMLPLLFVQLVYKSVWLLAVWLPAKEMITDGRDLVVAMFGGVVLDLVVIPWPYVVSRFVRAPGERWTERTNSPEHASPRTRSQLLEPGGVLGPGVMGGRRSV